MTTPDTFETTTRQASAAKREGLDVKKLAGKFLAHWPLFTLSVIACVMVAWVYLRYATPKYKVTAQVLVKDDKRGGGMMDNKALEQMGIVPGGKNVDNEVELLKSRSLMEDVVRRLHLNVGYFAPGRVISGETFMDRPVTMYFLDERSEPERGAHHTIKLESRGAKGAEISTSAGRKVIAWGQVVSLPVGRVAFRPTDAFKESAGAKCEIRVSSVRAAVKQFQSSLAVQASNKQVSMIRLTMETENPDKGEVVLNKLIELYRLANVNDRNLIADSTIAFIDNRLQIVGNELAGIERDIQSFKQANGMTDLVEQTKILANEDTRNMRELKEQEMQLSLLGMVKDQLNNSPVGADVAFGKDIQDPAISNLIDKYNTTLQERMQALLGTTEAHPQVVNLDKQLAEMHQMLRRTVNMTAAQKGVQVSGLRRLAGGTGGAIRQVPAKEREFLEYSRQQNIKQELFLFLLQKREETAISKSSTIASARIVDSALADDTPTSPKRGSIYFTALIFGLLLPSVFLYLRSLFSVRISSRADLEEATDIPVVGEIGHYTGDTVHAVTAHARTIIAEQFRGLRTNLQFLSTGPEEKTILLTSSASGEGKSFLAINLAHSLALLGKRVAVLEMDLRKPRISKYLGLPNESGISTYVTGRSNLDSIVKPSGVHELLYVVSSGPIPPNPAELLMLPRVPEMIESLKVSFDYIIIDSAPIGLVTDAQILAPYANSALYVVRQGFTRKQHLNIANDIVLNGRIPKLHLVVNDVKRKRSNGYGYGAGYGYGYGYKEYGDYVGGGEPKREPVKRLKALFGL